MRSHNILISYQHKTFWQGQAALVICISLACLVGIYSRPSGYVSTFWPANPIMLGILLRHPHLGSLRLTWVLSFLAFFVTDILTGASLSAAILYNLGNVLGVFVSWIYLKREIQRTKLFHRQSAVMYLITACLIAAAVITLIGAPSQSWLSGNIVWHVIAIWLSSEFYSFILIIPIFLTAPRGWFWTWKRTDIFPNTHMHNAYTVWPLLSLLVAECAAWFIGGPGALTFIMPPLIWCAIAYGIFPSTVITLVICTWKTASIAIGAFSFTPDHYWDVMSFRIGLSLLSLAPLVVASAYGLRMRTLQKLNHSVNHDFLTGTLTRRAMEQQGEKLLSRLRGDGKTFAILMLDIDHFKQVNDLYGHAQGDVVLKKTAAVIREVLRPNDLLGRMGGEEFAVLLPDITEEQAIVIGQRICDQVAQHAFVLNTEKIMRVTISVGVHAPPLDASPARLEQLVAHADKALYLAKKSGRNQVQKYSAALEQIAL